MGNLLHMDASVRTGSLSRELSQRYAQRWQRMNPEGTVVRRDLAADPLPHVTEVQADHLMYQNVEPGTEKPEEVLRCERLIEELRKSDQLLLGMPMYNFTIPSTVKAWIDHITWPGHTFDPMEGKGFLDIPAVVVISRGGGYGPTAPRADFNFQEPYLRKALGLIGIVDIEFVAAELTIFTGENSPDEQLKAMGEQSLQDAIEQIDKLTPVPE